ncbi:MAG: ATP-binding cassette domain-containing protein [Alphaproteobacteria bacterium]|nr:ATP-binding cassette domain-containing protein [Alphaproteobacteria bacterium]MDE2341323.1 ATP-binding cassette domain-containing protein [Alphaproteobacteria bacterium]
MVWALTLHYPLRCGAALIALFVSSGAMVALSWGLKNVIDKGFGGGAHSGHWFLILFGIVATLACSTAIRFYNVSWLGERVVADIRIAVQTNLLRLSPSYFEENRPSEIASRLTADTTMIERVVSTSVSIALRNFLIAVLGVAYIIYLDPKLALIVLVAIPVIILPIVYISRKLRGIAKASQDSIAHVGSTVSEVLGAMKIVQAFGQENREAGRFRSAAEEAFGRARRRVGVRAFMTLQIMFTMFGALVGVMWEAGQDYLHHQITGGDIAAFLLTGGIVAGAFGALSDVYGDMVQGAGAAARLNELLAEQPGIAAPPHPQALPEPPQGRVTFANVTFRYPTRPDVAALHDFSLDVKPGEALAVVGPSGAGKSTLFQLIQRFYDPQAGQVSVDGVHLPDADPAQVRERLAMVPQETIIFAASARENLSYGRPGADDAALWAAAEAANAAEFLRALPHGLDTFLGEGGARLSGGQRQRLAIARAILRDAPILLLDEATSALDAESERLVQDALDHLLRGRTSIVIAHRLATVRAADRIIVMDQGRIVEQGRHEDLAAANGLYARLAHLQFDA